MFLRHARFPFLLFCDLCEGAPMDEADAFLTVSFREEDSVMVAEVSHRINSRNQNLATWFFCNWKSLPLRLPVVLVGGHDSIILSTITSVPRIVFQQNTE
jgi:hypothetical protein